MLQSVSPIFLGCRPGSASLVVLGSLSRSSDSVSLVVPEYLPLLRDSSFVPPHLGVFQSGVASLDPKASFGSVSETTGVPPRNTTGRQLRLFSWNFNTEALSSGAKDRIRARTSS